MMDLKLWNEFWSLLKLGLMVLSKLKESYFIWVLICLNWEGIEFSFMNLRLRTIFLNRWKTFGFWLIEINLIYKIKLKICVLIFKRLLEIYLLSFEVKNWIYILSCGNSWSILNVKMLRLRFIVGFYFEFEYISLKLSLEFKFLNSLKLLSNLSNNGG